MSRLAGRHASTLASLVLIALVAAVALPGRPALALYALSFWHYYVYGLAFRYGAIAHDVFRRDALLLKSVSIVALGAAYFSAAIDLTSLAVVTGFLLNVAAARALGADRTYYGHEVAGLPHHRTTAFPYGWISHPMLVGNMMGFGGTLLNAAFRRQWWPLAIAHVLLNLALLVMETRVTPLRHGAIPRQRDAGPVRSQFPGWRASVAAGAGVAAAIGAAAGAWSPWTGHSLVAASLGAAMLAHTVVIYFCYAFVAAPPERGRRF